MASGRTTSQLTNAPQQAIFICVSDVSCAEFRELAKSLGRTDIEFKTPHFLRPSSMAGLTRHVMVASEVKLTDTVYALLKQHRDFLQHYKPPQEA